MAEKVRKTEKKRGKVRKPCKYLKKYNYQMSENNPKNEKKEYKI